MPDRGAELFSILRSANFLRPAATVATTTRGGGASTASFASRRTLERVQRPPRQIRATVAAAGAIIPVVYGRCRLGARIAQAKAQSSELTLLGVLGMGVMEGLDAIYVNDTLNPPGVTWEFFNGAPDQTVSATLQSKIPGWSSTLTGARGGEDFGVAYAVVRVPASAVEEGFPIVEFIVRGKHVYDPRTDTTAYSANPVLALRDFAASALYGAGLTVDDASFAAAAEIADSYAGGERLRTIGLPLEERRAPAAWLEVLATYAGVYLVRLGATLYAIPDWTATPGAEIDASQILDGSFRLSSPSRREIPTAVTVRWTDPATGDEQSATDYAAGVTAATARESVVPLPGVTSAQEALRIAGLRRRSLALGRFIADWDMPDEALAIAVGDVRPITHPVLTAAGLAPHAMRITAIEPGNPGRWRVTARTYDPAVYVEVSPPDEPPTAPDTDMPISSTRYTTTTSITAPAAAIMLEYEITAGGGGGEGSRSGGGFSNGGRGGGGGQTVRGRVPVTGGASLTITIGAGGPGGAVEDDGANGGDTTVTGGGLEGVIARGGYGGDPSAGVGGAPGGGYGDDVAASDGGDGGRGGDGTGQGAGMGGGSGRYPGGSPSGTANLAGGGGGAAANGPGGAGGSSGANGAAPASGYGGGGGGGGRSGGAGAAGRSGVAVLTFW